MAQRQKCVTVNEAGCGFDSDSRKGNISYYHFLAGNETKRRVIFRHLTYVAFRVLWKVGNETVVMET